MFYSRSSEWKLATVQQLESKIALIPTTLNQSGCIHGDAVAVLLCCETVLGDLLYFRRTRLFVLVLAETVDSVKAELLIGEAQVPNSRVGSSAAGPRVDDGVADAAILQPAGFAAVQELELPGGVQLTHFGHRGAVSNAGLGRIRVVHLLEAF